MTTQFEVRRALAQEIDGLALNLRRPDLVELQATAFDDDPRALLRPFTSPQALQQGFFIGPQLVALWAAAEQHPGLYSLGFVASPDWRPIAKAASRYIKQDIKPRLFAQGMRKGLALSLVHNTQAHRWMQWLGMNEEARLAAHGKAGEDFLLFSILAEGQAADHVPQTQIEPRAERPDDQKDGQRDGRKDSQR